MKNYKDFKNRIQTIIIENMKIIEKLTILVDSINQELKGSYLNRIICLSEYDYLFQFSKPNSNSILISLNIKNPFIKLTNHKFLFNETNPFFAKLKAKLSNAYFLGASILNEDNILVLDFIKTTDTYDKIHYKLVFEIFKSNSNLVLLVDGKVDEAFRFKGIDTKHPIIKNCLYEAPTKVGFEKEVKEKDEFEENNYFLNIEHAHLLSSYKEITISLKRKLKSLEKKVQKIKEDQDKAKENLVNKDYADALLCVLDEVKRGDSFFIFNEVKIPLNEQYSPSENLQKFYKVYKKSKATISSTEIQINQTNDEIDYIKSILSSIDYFNDDDFKETINELINKNIIKIPKKYKIKNFKNAHHPYYVIFNNTKIGFGKNSTQNNELTFNIASKNDYFLHVKNNHGNHVIIFKKDLDDDTLEFALGLTIYLSKNVDGEVILASCKDIKKGNEPGLVKLNKYESYTIKNLKYNYKEIVDKANRF